MQVAVGTPLVNELRECNEREDPWNIYGLGEKEALECVNMQSREVVDWQVGCEVGDSEKLPIKREYQDRGTVEGVGDADEVGEREGRWWIKLNNFSRSIMLGVKFNEMSRVQRSRAWRPHSKWYKITKSMDGKATTVTGAKISQWHLLNLRI